MTSTYDTRSIAVMTSIAPYNIENQRKAVNSWLEAGFKVMSYNCPDEIEKLSPFFEDIEFIKAKRDARADFGKPYVYFFDIMNFFKNSDYDICGIINSDIHFRGISQGLIKFIENEAKGALVFGQRVDIDGFGNLDGDMYIGFDYFFFDRKITCIYPREKFCIGQPVWDYWIIFVAAINNIPTKKLTNHIAYHIKHKQNWSEEANNALTDVVLDKYMGFLGEKPLSRDVLYREYKRYVFHKNEEIYYSFARKEPGILVVYDDYGIKDTEKSLTLQSVLNQHYNNYRVLTGTIEALDYSCIKEDMVYFIREGFIANRDYLRIMSEHIRDKEFAVCGIKVTYPESLSIDFVYPHSIHEGKNDNRAVHSCILYKTDYLKSCGIPGNIDMRSACFVGQGMVELISNQVQLQYYEGLYERITDLYSDYFVPEILFYVAMSYRHLGDLNKAYIYFFKLLENSDKCITDQEFINLQYSYDGIVDIILENDCEIDTDIWQRLCSFCAHRADIRYKLLSSLYARKRYDKMLEFESAESEEVYFYLGRAYKDMEKNDLAEHFLNKFILSVIADEHFGKKPVLGRNYLISAYYHLGEISFMNKEYEKARENFTLCMTLTHMSHKKSEEYLAKLSNLKK